MNKKCFSTKSLTQWLLSFLPYAILFPMSFAKFSGTGMFFDGAGYAAIARNMAIGNGSFWSLHMNNIVQDQFREHPPLGFWIQSLFFKLFGDYRYTEKIYIICIGLLLVFLIGKMWDVLTQKAEIKWPAQIIIVLCYSFYGSLSRNFLEIPMMIFMCLSIISIAQCYQNKKQFYAMLYAILSGIFALCAALIKPPLPFALFAISFFIYFIFHKKIHVLFFQSLFLFSVPFLLFAVYILFFNSMGLDFLTAYTHNQLLASLSGKREISSPHFNSLKFFKEDLLISISVFGVLFLATQRKFLKLIFNRTTIIFLLCALSTGLPLLLSPKNFHRYALPSSLFLTFFLISCFGNYFSELNQKIKAGQYKLPIAIVFTGVVFVGLGINIWSSGRLLGRGSQLDYFKNFGGKALPNNINTFSVAPNDNINTDWEFRNNFARDYPNIAVRYNSSDGRYWVCSSPIPQKILDTCIPLHITSETSKYQIFDCSVLFNCCS